MIRVTVNGEPETLESGENLLGYLGRKNINLHRVVCELNETIIRRPELEKTILKEGDNLEIITMMGGG
jgi:sulfur carrier protein